MEYAALVDVYRRLEATASNNEKTRILADLFAERAEPRSSDADDGSADISTGSDADLLSVLVTLVRGKLFAAWEPDELGVSSSLTLRAVSKATGVSEGEIEERWEATGDLGDAAAWAVENSQQRTLFSEPLGVRRVHRTLRELAEYEGAGSQDRRIDAVASLVSDADPEAARYVVRTALGHMRVGIGEGTVRDAIALAFLDGATDGDTLGTEEVTEPRSVGQSDATASDEAVAAVERAHQVTNDFPLVARTARDEGREGLAALGIELFRPVKSMLAEKAEGIEDGLDSVAPDLSSVLLEHKYDGARIQIHVDGDEVRVFTRRLEDVTAQFPDVVAAVREHVTADSCVLDGEAVGYDPDTERPVVFQEFSRRIKREYDIAELAEEIPAVVYLFDCLAVDGESLLDAPLRDRLARLDDLLDPEPLALERATHRSLADCESRDDALAAAESLYADALDAGHEGLMLKNLDAVSQPGRRVGAMMKVKPTMEPLDLVVPRAQYSEGRRSEWLGRLFLGAYDPDADAFVVVGRLATGYTDEELQEITDRLEPLVTDRDGRILDVDPELVLEVEYEEIQQSPEYESGYALRFPRFVRIRDDLAPEDADTVERVGELFDQQ
ncbi:ATP-dependent DNA ligase [Halomarina salina]|uniref:DNA ligase n=1 Tax=Halomarina salina TaxID=1872699 RepID=A0ABD5RKI6_9EURY|nr:ATP-dependent DNA ligase [Halomarina salina]